MATMDFAKIQAELEALRAENAKLKNAKQAGIQVKLSDKGCISVYTGSRFPVSLYRDAWEMILDNSELIRDFIKENEDKLPTLNDKKAKLAAATAKKEKEASKKEKSSKASTSKKSKKKVVESSSSSSSGSESSDSD